MDGAIILYVFILFLALILPFAIPMFLKPRPVLIVEAVPVVSRSVPSQATTEVDAIREIISIEDANQLCQESNPEVRKCINYRIQSESEFIPDMAGISPINRKAVLTKEDISYNSNTGNCEYSFEPIGSVGKATVFYPKRIFVLPLDQIKN